MIGEELDDHRPVHGSGSAERRSPVVGEDRERGSTDLFDVEASSGPFRSTSIQVVGDRATLLGELTIRDVTREVQLDVAYVGSVRDPWGSDRVVFSATGRLDREQWGLTWNLPLDNGGLLVSKEIDVEIELEATRDA